MYKVGMISLGCPKNRVDAEMMIAKLVNAGFEISDDIIGCDAVIINTCAFIDDAKKEAIDNILEVAGYKADGQVGKIIVTGCLSERYKKEVRDEMPEVDTVVGIGADGDIVNIVRDTIEGKNKLIFPPKSGLPLEGQRVLTTPPYQAYIKISEGCDNRCAYCAIPSIRGPQRSRKIEDIIKEAHDLAQSGVKELIVIAQDTTRYGTDIYKKQMLPELLYKLNDIDGIEWIRVLYCYPERIDDELIKAFSECDKVVKYIDIPMQHADKDILRKMHRAGSSESLTALVERLRDNVPGIVIRTTVMTGFPSETDEQFGVLLDFVKKTELDRLGCFEFCPEEGTEAASMDGQVPDDVKKKRGELIMQAQYDIFIKNNNKLTGRTFKVINDAYDAYKDIYIGRTYMDAPEIDSVVYYTCSESLQPGTFTDVLITDCEGYDLYGKAVEDK
jgi:ribosomal protein S12 methylthiotransferase